MNGSFRLRTGEFDRALKAYMEVTKKSLPEVLNKKGLFIARGALRETPKTDAKSIRSTLGVVVRRPTGNRLNLKPSDERPGMSLAEAILRARYFRQGKPQPTSAEMPEKNEAFLNARNRSIAFLKSGWIPAIRTLDAVVRDRAGAPPRDSSGAQVIGADKGRAVPAVDGLISKCLIENRADAKHDVKDALLRYGGPALQRAFDKEAASMMAEVARRQAEEAKRIGTRVVSSI